MRAVAAACRTVACAWFEVNVAPLGSFAVAVAWFVTDPVAAVFTSAGWIVYVLVHDPASEAPGARLIAAPAHVIALGILSSVTTNGPCSVTLPALRNV